ncbi:MAG: hypothetical protein V4467_03140 [Patescibacteria group bacterium]
MEKIRFFWNIAYRVWPPCIRTAEKLGFHNFRQKFLLGRLNSQFNKSELAKLLYAAGFEAAVIAWHDPGQVLSMRKIDSEIYQYHLRLFVDGEIRAHYEYSPESHPLSHFLEARFEPRTEIFKEFLGNYLVAEESKTD